MHPESIKGRFKSDPPEPATPTKCLVTYKSPTSDKSNVLDPMDFFFFFHDSHTVTKSHLLLIWHYSTG